MIIALETDYYLSKINSKSKIIIDGNFAKNIFFVSFLKILRNKQKVFSYQSINSSAGGFLCYFNKNKFKKSYVLNESHIFEKIELVDKIKKYYKKYKNINNQLF